MTQPLPHLPITVKGTLGSVHFDGWTVTVRHSMPGRPDASVPLDQLSGVELQSANVLQAGLFTLLVGGTVAPRRGIAARTNPLALGFQLGSTGRFEQLRDVLLAAIAARRTHHQPQSYPPPQHAAPQAYPAPQAYTAMPSAPSLADELQRLGQMVQQGLLSPAEFEQAKARLLGGPRQ